MDETRAVAHLADLDIEILAWQQAALALRAPWLAAGSRPLPGATGGVSRRGAER